MKVWVGCYIISVVDEQCYQGRLAIGSCEMAFKLSINNDLFEEYYEELTGESVEDISVDLIRQIVDISIKREGQVVVLSDMAYSFLNMLLMSLKDRFVEMSSGRESRYTKDRTF